MAAITLVYLLDACTIYVLLYRSRVLNPLETNENRGPWIRLQIKGTVYSCIFIVAFVAVSATLDMLHLKQWHPFAVSVFLVGCTLTFFTSLAAAPRYPETPELSAGAGR
jgi:undecaprenyl pyrophosphate phosphatase UppP